MELDLSERSLMLWVVFFVATWNLYWKGGSSAVHSSTFHSLIKDTGGGRIRSEELLVLIFDSSTNIVKVIKTT